jgi:O-antigen biosynthesis protein
MRAPRFSVVVLRDGDPTNESTTTASINAQGAHDWEIVPSARSDQSGQPAHEAIASARGEFILFMDAGDVLHRDALARLDAHITEQTDLIYTDEDSISGTVRSEPFYKPDWSPERLLNQHYLGRACAFRRSLVHRVGALRPEAGTAWEYDLALRVSQHARRIDHVPSALYHRAGGGHGHTMQLDDAQSVVDAHLLRIGAPLRTERNEQDSVIRLRPRLPTQPRVGIVIPTAGIERRVRAEVGPLVVNCVQSVLEHSSYENFELICVFDSSTDPKTLRALEQIAGERLHLVEYGDEFNFSRKINLGVIESDSEYLLLLNDDTEVVTSDWIETLVAFASDDGVGAVGALLRFGDGRIQHAGVVLDRGIPGHAYYGYPGDHPGYRSSLRIASNCSVVTAACLMTRREDFMKVGGFSPLFPRNYNDVDYCLKLRSSGSRIVFTPEVQLAHYESSSRGFVPVARAERVLLEERWGPALLTDPYYNVNFLPGANSLTLIDADGRTPSDVGLR